MRVSWGFVVIVLALPLPARSQEAAATAPKPPAPPSHQAGVSPASPPDHVTDQRAFDRIRTALASSPSLFDAASGVQRHPTFRTTVVGRLFEQTPLVETLLPEWQPVQPGLFYHNELVYRFTQPQARPYGAFSGAELAQVAASSLASAALIRAAAHTAKAIRAGVRRVQVRRVNRQIDDALAVIEARRLGGESPTKAP